MALQSIPAMNIVNMAMFKRVVWGMFFGTSVQEWVGAQVHAQVATYWCFSIEWRLPTQWALWGLSFPDAIRLVPRWKTLLPTEGDLFRPAVGTKCLGAIQGTLKGAYFELDLIWSFGISRWCTLCVILKYMLFFTFIWKVCSLCTRGQLIIWSKAWWVGTIRWFGLRVYSWS